RSTAAQNGNPPLPCELHAAARWPADRTRSVTHALTVSTTQKPNLSSQRLTTNTGPPIARPVQITATNAVQTATAEKPNSSLDTAAATCPIAQNSNTVQPISWARFRTVGIAEPPEPRIERNRTIDGTPSLEPATPTRASGTHPIALPTTIATIAVRRPRAGTRSAPETRTNRPIERSPQRTAT